MTVRKAAHERTTPMPILKHFSSFELARNLRAFFGLQAGVVRGEVPSDGALSAPETGVRPESIVWIFSSGRSGTTWLRDLLCSVSGYSAWEEPLVGRLFGTFLESQGSGSRRGGNFILSDRHREAWLGAVRKLVLDGAASRFPERDGFVVVKEPNGSMGAPLLSAAIPESRLITLVRDPRDVCASSFDGKREGGWQNKRRANAKWSKQNLAGSEPEKFIETLASNAMRNMRGAIEAYRSHEGPKTLIKYEDLISDTPGTLHRLYKDLRLPVSEEDLVESVHKNSWAKIPEKKRGEGKFYRKGTSGGWREDLTPGQIEVVERVTAPVLREFYDG